MTVLFARLMFAIGIGVPGCVVWTGVFAVLAGGWGTLLGPPIIVIGIVALGFGWGIAMLITPSASLSDSMNLSALGLFAMGPVVLFFAPVSMAVERAFDSPWPEIALAGPVVVILFLFSAALIPSESTKSTR